MFNIFKILLFSLFFIVFSDNALNSNFLFKISYFMLKPYYECRSQLSKTYIPFHPDLFDQKNTHVKELIHRNILLRNFFSMAPTALTLGILAQIPETLYHTFRKNPFEYIPCMNQCEQLNENKFSILNLNVCFLPGELPLFFGGVLPASDRVKKIAKVLLEKNADIICLYEVHDIVSAYDLIYYLKKKYNNFYFNIGSNIFGMNSGLFIASKYKTSTPLFKPFHYIGKQGEINKGYFKFDLLSNEKIISKIYTTHLQPYQKKSDEEIRFSELSEIIEDMETEFHEDIKYPFILCGDLNISWDPKDKNLAVIDDHFFNPYTPKKSHIKNHTYSSYLSDFLWNNIQDSSYFLEIIDYLLIFKKTKDSASIKTSMVPMLNLHSPGNDLSDHNGLLSIIELGDS